MYVLRSAPDMKHPSTPGHDRHPVVRVVAEPPPRVGQVAEVVEVERVPGLGPVDRDPGDVPVELLVVDRHAAGSATMPPPANVTWLLVAGEGASVSIAISDDHLALLDTARRFTAARCTPAVARAVMEKRGRRAPRGRPPFWQELAELGWLGLAVPEVRRRAGLRLRGARRRRWRSWAACSPRRADAADGVGGLRRAVGRLTAALVAGTRAGGVARGPCARRRDARRWITSR